MTAKNFRILMWEYMLLVVLAGGILGALVPAVPTWAFLAGGLALGVVMLFVAARILKRNDLILKDERTRRNSEKAMAWAYRAGIWAAIAAVALIDAVPGPGRVGSVVSRTLIVVLAAQYALFLVFYFILNRRDEA